MNVPLDLSHEPWHGPAWAPKATPQQLAWFRAHGSVCWCTTCQRYRRELGIDLSLRRPPLAAGQADPAAVPTPRERIKPLEAVAVHESGHQIVAAELNIRTRKAYIRRHWDGSASGAVEVHDDVVERPREMALVLVGGIQATALWLRRVHGHEGRQATEWGDATGCNDLREFRQFAPRARLPLDVAKREVDAILARHYSRLLRGAALLQYHRSISASKI